MMDAVVTPTSTGQRARTGKLLAPALAVLAGLVYLNALDNPFVFDDQRLVMDNPSLRDLSNFVFVLVFERFRPLINLSYALDYQVWGLNPLGYHLTSLGLHMVNVVLLFFLVEAAGAEKGAARGLAALAAGLFAVHPLMTEAVGYVSGRSEVLCGTFFLAALLAFWRAFVRRSRWWLGPAVLFWVLALAAKEVAALLPVVLLLADRLLAVDPERRRLRLLRVHLPLLVLVVAAAAVRGGAFLLQESANVPRMGHYALTELGVIWRYLGLLTFPAGQSIVHSVREASGPLDPLFLLAGAGLLGLVALAWRVRRRLPLLTLGLSWFLLLLAPSALIPLQQLMAEHRVYLASAGAFLAAAALLRAGAARARDRLAAPRWLPAAAAVGLLLLLSVLTVLRNRVWDDPVTLWRDAVAQAPDVFAAHYALGDAYRQERRCTEAIPHYRRAIQLLPDRLEAQNNLGICLALMRRYSDAEQVFRRVLARDPRFVSAHTNLGLLARLRRRPGEARGHFLRALELDPNNAKARQELEALSRAPLGPPR